MVDNSDFKYLDGCGCGFYPSDRPPHIDRADSQKYFLVATGDKGWMNIDGEIVELLRTKDETRYQGKVGEEFKQLYQSDDTAVEVTCKATGFGDTHAVFCDAIITVKKDNQKKVIECAGDCGC